jgi:hypothetical protein
VSSLVLAVKDFPVEEVTVTDWFTLKEVPQSKEKVSDPVKPRVAAVSPSLN